MKSIEEIYGELMVAFAERAGFLPEESCDLAVRLYAAAAQIQALSMQGEWVLDQSFPQTAQGVYLDRHAAMRGVSRAAATRAGGILRFSVGQAAISDLTIAAGTVCMTAEELRFQTTQAAVLAAGELSVDVETEAVEPGAAYNAVAGSVSILTACPVGITACTNPTAFSGGSDEETDASLRGRILESYQRLPNGANAAYYEQTAMGHAGVTAAKAVGRARGIGTVDVYVATEAGPPDAVLLAEIQADLQRKREIAVDVRVLAPTGNAVHVTAEIAVAAGAEFAAVKAAVERALDGFFTGRLLGRPVLLAELGRAIFSVEGVKNYHILAPAADVAGADTALSTAGTICVTQIKEA